jgi:hypothetical protein
MLTAGTILATTTMMFQRRHSLVDEEDGRPEDAGLPSGTSDSVLTDIVLSLFVYRRDHLAAKVDSMELEGI